jgi:hypothetical protein
MTRDEYLRGLASELVHELERTITVKKFTENPNLLSGYTEATIRGLIRRIVYPMHVSTGAVLDFPVPESLRQRDVIIWAPFPAPGVFEVEGFALVPRSSAFGVLEIKRSNYAGIDGELEQFVVEAVGSVAARGGSFRDDPTKAVLGVIAVLESKASARLQHLIENGRVVAVLSKYSGSVTVRPNDVFTLVNTLHFISWRYRVQSSGPDFPEIVPIPPEKSG